MLWKDKDGIVHISTARTGRGKSRSLVVLAGSKSSRYQNRANKGKAIDLNINNPAPVKSYFLPNSLL